MPKCFNKKWLFLSFLFLCSGDILQVWEMDNNECTLLSLIKEEKEEALPESHQAFGIAAARTSRLVNLVFSYIQLKQASISW